MAIEKKVYFIILAIFAFIAYTLLAARPIPPETILTNKWLIALDSISGTEEIPANIRNSIIPFKLGTRYGYVDSSGALLLHQIQEQTVSLSPEYWAEFVPAPELITIKDPRTDLEITLEKPGSYPVFINGRIFLLSKDQTSLEELNREGTVLWRHDFEAPLTCIDAAAGFVLAGTLDGLIDLLDKEGKPLFRSFAPGGSRIPVILGCRISSDGKKLAILSGIDQQRFLFLEGYGNNDYRVTYHESLKGDGFRREMQMAFIWNDTRVVFEQETGLVVFDVRARSTTMLPLFGRLLDMDEDGSNGLFFYVCSGVTKSEKRFVAVKLPSAELINIPFKSEVSFLTRRKNELFIGGGATLASFVVDKR